MHSCPLCGRKSLWTLQTGGSDFSVPSSHPTGACFPLVMLFNLCTFPGGAGGQESTCQCRRHKWCCFDPWVGKIPWSRKWQPTPVFLPGEFYGQRSLVGYNPWGSKESDTTQLHGSGGEWTSPKESVWINCPLWTKRVFLSLYGVHKFWTEQDCLGLTNRGQKQPPVVLLPLPSLCSAQLLL